MHRIAAVHIADAKNFHLDITFADGRAGRVSLGHLAAGPAFREWHTPAGFAAVSIVRSGRALAWPGGADLCADALYYEVTGLTFETDQPRSERAA